MAAPPAGSVGHAQSAVPHQKALILRFFLAALVAMALNLIMDLGFDVPMLLRWAVAILGAVIAVQVLVRFTRKREGDPKTDS